MEFLKSLFKKKKYYLANIRNLNTDYSFCVLILAYNKNEAYEKAHNEFRNKKSLLPYEIEIDETIK